MTTKTTMAHAPETFISKLEIIILSHILAGVILATLVTAGYKLFFGEADRQKATIAIDAAASDGCEDAIATVQARFSANGYVSQRALRKLRDDIEICREAQLYAASVDRLSGGAQGRSKAPVAVPADLAAYLLKP